MNQFSERYKTLSTLELLKIIDTPGNYQALADEAAGTELANRNLTEQEIADARTEGESLELEKLAQKEKNKIYGNKIKEIGLYVVDAVNPVFETSPKTSRIINWLIALLGITFLYQLYDELPMLKYLLLYHKPWHFAGKSMFYLLLLIIPPTGVVLLWRRKILGWLLSTAFLICSVVIPLFIFFSAIARHFTSNAFSYYHGLINSSIGSMLFYGGCLWLIFRKDVREVYRVDKSAIVIASALGLIIVLFILVGVR